MGTTTDDSSASTLGRTAEFVRGFAQYLAAIDNLTEVPPPGLFPHHPKRVTPYIYSNREIALLLAAALRLPSADGLKRWTYYVLLGLLSVTGLRIGEALHMKLDDVDLHEGVLTVRDTKFGKSRLIPIYRSTQKVLANYLRRRSSLPRRTPFCPLVYIRDWELLDCGDVHEHSTRCLDRLAYVSHASAMALDYMTSVIDLPSRPSAMVPER